MSNSNPETNPAKKVLLVEIEGPLNEVDQIKAGIEEAADNVAAEGIKMEMNERIIEPRPYNPQRADFTPGLTRFRGALLPLDPSLCTWERTPDNGYISIITKQDLKDFSQKKLLRPSKDATMGRFFNALVSSRNYHSVVGDAYLYPDSPRERFDKLDESTGIKTNSALDLLRKLRLNRIGGRFRNGKSNIINVGKISIDIYEQYCTALFPGVDMSLATKELDLELMDTLLKRSEKRREVWGWVVRLAVGERFNSTRGSESYRDYQPPAGASTFLINLQALGLIDRRLSSPYGVRIQAPFEKLYDSRWSDLEKLMIERGDMPEPA